MASDRTRDIVLPVAMAFSITCGFLIGIAIERDEKGVATGALESDWKSLASSMDRLTSELQRTREQLHYETPLTPTSDRSVSAANDAAEESIAELRKLTASLTGAIDALRTETERGASSRAQLIAPPNVDPAAVEAMLSNTSEASKTHLLWTYQQVMTKFGAPDRMGHEEAGTFWLYSRGTRSAIFHFVDGYVVGVAN